MIRFLLDENMPSAIMVAIRRRDAQIDMLQVGQPGAPSLGTLDPDILLFCEREQRVLVTNNRHSMKDHIEDLFLAGHHHWGIIEVNDRTNIGQIASDLHRYWAAEIAENLIDGVFYI